MLATPKNVDALRKESLCDTRYQYDAYEHKAIVTRMVGTPDGSLNHTTRLLAATSTAVSSALPQKKINLDIKIFW